jgi:hypothetical protein
MSWRAATKWFGAARRAAAPGLGAAGAGGVTAGTVVVGPSVAAGWIRGIGFPVCAAAGIAAGPKAHAMAIVPSVTPARRRRAVADVEWTSSLGMRGISEPP